MLDLIRARLAQGTPTLRLEDTDDGGPSFPERFRGRPATDPIVAGKHGRAVLDLGAYLFAPEEAADGVVFTRDYRLSSRTRDGLVVADQGPPRMEALEKKMRRLFGRSLRLRSVVAGSCNGCESELNAASNVVFDMARFGIQFVASPRHADGIVITGTVNQNMRAALERTYAAVADPRLVIAVGACAASGGPFRGSAEAGPGVPHEIPVDLWIAGCPPHPVTILDGLLRLLGRIEEGR